MPGVMPGAVKIVLSKNRCAPVLMEIHTVMGRLSSKSHL